MEETQTKSVGHEPGPIQFDPGNYGVNSRPGWGLINELGNSLGVTVHSSDWSGKEIPNAKENAARMVLCWDEHDTLVSQRDELLEACQKFIAKLDGYTYAECPDVTPIRDAIAKATEKGQ